MPCLLLNASTNTSETLSLPSPSLMNSTTTANAASANNGAGPSYARAQPDTTSDTFASRVFAPAAHWYDEMRWTRSHPASDNKQRVALLVSYLPDWILTLVTAGLLQIINHVYGYRREFSLTDPSIQHTYALHERVTVPELAVYAFIIPLVLMGVVALGVSRSVWDFHAGLLGLVVAHALTLTATTIIKVCVGRPRPDFIDRCQPRAGAQNASPFGLATQAVCTADVTSRLISDGFRSFPSGHSSTAFAGLTFFTLWLAGKFHLWQRSRGNAASAWILFIPMLGATLIAVSRTMDYRHHATDVIAGGILGFVIAVSVYHSYYPPLWNSQSQKPWAPRTSFFGSAGAGARLAAAADPKGKQGVVSADADLERNPLQGHQRTYSGESSRATPDDFVSHESRPGEVYRDHAVLPPREELEMARSS